MSNREHEEVSEYERQYEDGSDPKVLDVIDVPLLEPRPNRYQPENWLLDPDQYWVKAGPNPVTLDNLTEHPESLWTNGHHTYNGVNDFLPVEAAETAGSSLSFIRVDHVQLSVYKPGAAFGNPKRRVQAKFRYGDAQYALWVTDPLIEKSYLAQDDGDYPLGQRYLTISLGEPFDGRCYKLVAAVIDSTLMS